MKNEASNSLQLSLFSRYPTNYQSNLFTESRQEFSELEKKIVTLVVNQLGNLSVQGQIQPNVNVMVRVPYAELTVKNHSLIAEAAELLSKKRISFKDEQNSDFIFITPFPYVKSLTENGRRLIEIKMLADVVPHFAALGQRYTKYDLDIMLSLSSVYAQRIFEIVSMNLHIKKMRFTYLVDELRNILNCPDTYRYNDFVANILRVAQRELQKKANILLDWQPTRKVGKRVIELEFEIKTMQQLAIEGVKEDALRLGSLSPNELVLKGYEIMATYQLKPWQKDIVITEMPLLETLFRVHSEFMNGMRPEVKSRTKYMAKSLGLDKIKAPQKKPFTSAQEPQINFFPSAIEKRIKEDRPIGTIINSLIPKSNPGK